jgi:hypothetical protein
MRIKQDLPERVKQFCEKSLLPCPTGGFFTKNTTISPFMASGTRARPMDDAGPCGYGMTPGRAKKIVAHRAKTRC